MLKTQKMYVPQDSSLLIPLKYVELSGGHNTLDALIIIGTLKVIGHCHCNGPVFTQCTPLNTTPLSGHTWSGRERRRCKQRPGPKTHGQKCGQARQRNLCKKKNSIGQKTSRRSNHARRLRGTCYVAPEDKELNATLKKREISWKCMWTLQCRANCERNPQGKIRDEHWRGEIFCTHNH